MEKLIVRWRHLLAATIGIGLGMFAMMQTSQMSELGRVFPMTASLIAITAGIGVLAQAVIRPATSARVARAVDVARVFLLSAVLLIWAISLEALGFVPSSAVAVVAVAVISKREPMSARSILLHALAGVILVVGFSLLLGQVLNVRLP